MAVDGEGRDVGGRPPLSGNPDVPSVKVGVWVPVNDAETLNETIGRMVDSYGGSRSDAHRAILMAGIRAVSTSLDCSDEQATEAAAYMRRRSSP